MLFEIALFLISVFILSWLSSRLVATLVDIARYLNWKEFIIAFFVMAFAATLPNLFVDINAALNGMPEVAFGDVIGGNFIDLTLVIAVAVLFGSRFLPAESEVVQKSAIFTSLIAILPILLMWNGKLERIDGIILLGCFFLYSAWLFSKESRFKKIYDDESLKSVKSENPFRDFFIFLINLLKIIIFLMLLLAASYFIIKSAQFFSIQLGISLSLVAILIVSLGNCFPEMYFSLISARRGENWLILGDLMGAVIMPATLVLGLIALIFPFEIKDLSPFLITRVFTIIASLFFLIFIRTGKKITKTEGVFFLFIYILFLLVQIVWEKSI